MFGQADRIRILGTKRKSDVRCGKNQDATSYPDQVDDGCVGGVLDNKPRRDQHESLGATVRA